MTGPVAQTRSSAAGPAEQFTADLFADLDAEFLSALGWSDERRVLVFPQGHPVLGWRMCAVVNCGQRGGSARHGCCTGCFDRWRAAGEPPLAEFVTIERVVVRRETVELCAVPRCARPWESATVTLCRSYRYQRQQLGLSLAEFVRHPGVVGLAGFGRCEVGACTRDRIGSGLYCHSHTQRLGRLKKAGETDAPGWDEILWRRTESGVSCGNEASLGSLPDRVVAELLFGVQYRVRDGGKTPVGAIRVLANVARAHRCESLAELDPASVGAQARKIHTTILTALDRRLRDPETERLKDNWDATVFGCKGTLRFTGLSHWLREAAKAWAADSLPRRRGDGAARSVRADVRSLERLSESLRLQRPDDGMNPASLGPADITAYLNRMAYLQAEGTISAYVRTNEVRRARLVLRWMRSLGLARVGQPLEGLPEDFTIRLFDLPDDPEDSEHGRDLPLEVIRFLCNHLDLLAEPAAWHARVAVELLIDTGRRPEEICKLAFDCLERDAQQRPVLVYNNDKSQRAGVRLPITEATAAVIEQQQRRVRARFPDEPAAKLKLLPTSQRNPHGRRPITAGYVSSRHRDWVDALPDIMATLTVEIEGKPVAKLLPFDKSRIYLYAYRHTYAQRHADAGVTVDVLRELMSHREMTTTQGYYRIGEQRRREAVDKVTAMQFDRHGSRIWRTAKALLDDEHLRRSVGAVAVPYGTCSEPSNVAAGGEDCPVRFRCVGCAHFSTDVSYLPDLEAYLADLLRSRERLRSVFDAAEDWAKAEAMPSEQEITRIRRLISRMKADVDELTIEDQTQIDEAVGVVRRARNGIVGLGLPRIRQPLPDIRPDRSA